LKKIRTFALQKIKPFAQNHQQVPIYQNLLDFFGHVIPFIFTFRKALKQKNFSFLLTLQPKLWLLLHLVGSAQYSKLFSFKTIFFTTGNKVTTICSNYFLFNQAFSMKISLSTVA
jgi:hypothetical protein